MRKNGKTQCVESQNHGLKEYTDFTPEKLVPIVNTTERVGDDQLSEVIKAITGTSTKYVLAKDKQHLYVNPTVWGQWGKTNPEKQQQHILKFFNPPRKSKKTQLIISQDGNLSMPLKAREVKQKPGTKGSGRGTRTRTFKNKKSVDDDDEDVPTPKKRKTSKK